MRCILGLLLACAAVASAESKPQEPPEGLYRDLLRVICPGKAASRFRGCEVCPEGTGYAGMDTPARIMFAAQGHFTTLDANQVLIAMAGCEPPYQSGADSFVFTMVDGDWRPSVESGGVVGDCQIVAGKATLDTVLCRSAFLHSGEYLEEISAYGKGTIVTARGRPGRCVFADRGEIDESAIKEFRPTVNPEGKVSLTVIAVCQTGRLICRNGEDLSTPRSRSFQFEYVLGDKGFQVTKGTASALAVYKACAHQ